MPPRRNTSGMRAERFGSCPSGMGGKRPFIRPGLNGKVAPREADGRRPRQRLESTP